MELRSVHRVWKKKTTCILTSEKRTVRLKPAKQTNRSLLFLLANANFLHLAAMENLSEWTEEYFYMLICSAHLRHISPMLGITLQCYSCTNPSQRYGFISEVTSGEIPPLVKFYLQLCQLIQLSPKVENM